MRRILDPRDELRLVVALADGGRTWTDRVPDGPYDTHTLAAHPAAPGRLYSAAGDGYGAPGRGYSESSDGGEPLIENSNSDFGLSSLGIEPRSPQVYGC